MYALFEIKGKQYKAVKGSVIKVDRFSAEKGDKIEFDKVLLVSEDEDVKVGLPYVDGAKVTAVVEEQTRDKKILVFKFKRRKDYKKTLGHKQPYTKIKIEDIQN